MRRASFAWRPEITGTYSMISGKTSGNEFVYVDQTCYDRGLCLPFGSRMVWHVRDVYEGV